MNITYKDIGTEYEKFELYLEEKDYHKLFEKEIAFGKLLWIFEDLGKIISKYPNKLREWVLHDSRYDICNQPPVFYPESYNDFGAGKQYLCKPFYRLNTKVLDDLYEIRAMERTDIINQLNEFGFCLHILDDGSRGNLWEVCLAEWTQEEKDLYQKICMSRFGLACKQNKDDRYYTFNAVSSKKIDQMILNNFPNDLDIIHKKILDNNKIKKLCHYRYVLLEDGKIGLGNYCRRINRFGQYEMIRDVFDSIGTEEVEESVLLEAISHII